MTRIVNNRHVGSTELLVSVIIPTLREVGNLRTLLPMVSHALTTAGLQGEIIVVDDDSNDGTVSLCHKLRVEVPIRLIVRRAERGLATAVLCGMNLAHGNVFLVMDADFSHAPDAIPRLIEPLGSFEFVIGSRYTPGASIDQRWGWLRSLNSRVATFLARGLTSVGDPMAGFFALRRGVFDRSRGKLNPLGYKIGLELLVKSRCRRVTEVPIRFADRCRGESKLSLAEQLRYLRHLARLYRWRWTESPLLRFGLVGTIGMLIDLTTFSALQRWVPLSLARATGITAAVLANYALNRRFTFAAQGSADLKELGRFLSVCSAGAFVSWVVSVGLIRTGLLSSLPAAITGIAAGAAVNYLGCRYYAFAGRGRHQTREATSGASG